MAQTDWTLLNDTLDAGAVDRGATTGIARAPGGGSFVFGFNSPSTAQGLVGLFTNQVNFAPMSKGGSVRAALQRGLSGGPLNFAPFVFIGLGGPSANDQGYLLGLADGDPHHIALRKGVLSVGLPDIPPGTQGVLRLSTTTFAPSTWV